MIRSLEPSMLNLSFDVPTLAPLCAEYGIEAVGAPQSIFEDETLRRQAAEAMERCGLKWGLLPMPADFYFWELSDEGFRAGLEELHRRGAIAEKLGIRFAYNHVWPCSTRPFDENFEWHVDRVRRVTHVLKEHGVRYGLEFIGPFEVRSFAPQPFVHSLAGIAAIADAAGEGTGVAFDSYHWYCSHNGDMGELMWMAEHSDRLVAFHMNDAVPGREYFEQKDMERRLPMDSGIINTRDILARFRRTDPDALYMIEPFQPAGDFFAKLSPREAVAKAAEIFRRVEGRE